MMSEPFPSKAYQELCIENADRLREEWEPKCGDWVLCWDGDEERWGAEPWLVLSWYCEDALDVILPDGTGGPVLLNEVIPLFQPRQIWRMLEESGYVWMLRSIGFWPNEEEATVRAWPKRVHTGDEVIATSGPDPATALLRAWLEATGKEQPNAQEGE